jgi:hypothetical protein
MDICSTFVTALVPHSDFEAEIKQGRARDMNYTQAIELAKSCEGVGACQSTYVCRCSDREHILLGCALKQHVLLEILSHLGQCQIIMETRN